MRRQALALAASLVTLACGGGGSETVGAGGSGGGSAGAGGGGSGGGGGSPEDVTPWLEPFPARRRIVFHPTLEGPLHDFPVPVVIDDDPLLAEVGTTDGFAFTDADGTTLRHLEVERFDKASGAAVLWLRAPDLVPDEDRVGYLYYGHPDPPMADGRAAWREGFTSVWHLADDPTVPTPVFRDSVGGNHAGPLVTLPTSEPGIAGPALRFAGVDDELLVNDPPDGSFDFGVGSFSLSLWVYVTESVGDNDSPLAKGGGCDTCDPGFGVHLGNGVWQYGIVGGGNSLYITFGDQARYLGRWVHLTMVVDRQRAVLEGYADGVSQSEYGISGFGSTSGTFALAIGDSFSGVIDEVRIHARALDHAWIAAEHASLSDPAAFHTLGPPQAR